MERPYRTEVPVDRNGPSQHISPILLRDLCQCAACRDPSTRQKLFSTADIPSSIRDASLVQDEHGIRVTWVNDIPGYPDDHTTSISHELLTRIRETGIPTAPAHSYTPGPQVTWDAAGYSRLQDIDYEAYMEDDPTLFRALQQLHSHGLLFLSNVPGDEKSVKRLAKRIGPLKNTFYGKTWDVRSVPDSKNVAYTSQDLGFHMDLLYMHQPPHVQLLHCIRSSSSGGASLFTDSYKAATDMFDTEPDNFLALSSVSMNFHYDHAPTQLYHQSRTVFELVPLRFGALTFHNLRSFKRFYEEGQRGNAMANIGEDPRPRGALRIMDYLAAVNWSPPFQAPLSLLHPTIESGQAGDGVLSGKMDRWHRAAQVFSKLIHRPEGIYERMMKPGQCVIFDNRRVLHARRAFDAGDAGKERWLRGAYLDKDPYLSRLRTLHTQLR